jgi:hypothetical protein
VIRVGTASMALLSMSARHPEGRDAEYLEWHMLDHLPEQYRISGIRNGQRWVSTPACRSARAASVDLFDEVDHVVQYLFAEPIAPALDAFFALGAELHAAGRMPIGLPRRHLAGHAIEAEWGSERAMVDGSVVPWRPATGVYLMIERVDPAAPPPRSVLDVVSEARPQFDGVAGGWQLRGLGGLHPRLGDAADLSTTVLYLDGNPPSVGAAIGEHLASRRRDAGIEVVLGAPFEVVVPWRWQDRLPLP